MRPIAFVVERGVFFFALGVLVYMLTHDNHNGET